MIDDLTIALEERTTQVIGKRYECYASLTSTNALMRERAESGAPEGLVIVADEQTAGRGRMGRRWVATPGQSLMLSILLRPPLPPTERFILTMLAGVALCEAVEAIAGCQARLKWPNDLLLGHDPPRKAAGILAENGADRVILGIGVNVAGHPHGTVDGRDLASNATSVYAAAGRPVPRAELLATLLQRFETHYLDIPAHRGAVFAAWRNRLHTLGRPVSVSLPASTLRGVAEDVDQSGSLLVRDQAGRLHTIAAGDVEA